MITFFNNHILVHLSMRKSYFCFSDALIGENLIILGETDWRVIEKALYLNWIPGLVESIREADEEPLSEGKRREDIGW